MSKTVTKCRCCLIVDTDMKDMFAESRLFLLRLRISAASMDLVKEDLPGADDAGAMKKTLNMNLTETEAPEISEIMVDEKQAHSNDDSWTDVNTIITTRCAATLARAKQSGRKTLELRFYLN
jgi:hypothetical protein